VGRYEHKFKVYGTANVMHSSFEFLNDSTIVTSGAAQTLIGSSGYKMDYEKLYFSYLSNDTFRIRMAYNLLELVNSEGNRIRFHYSIPPLKHECTNLLVPVCFSVSHAGYASARMEPVFMMVGE
jgi:hypothetical protein